MEKTIDCLFIGYNEVSLQQNKARLRTMGFKKDSIEVREINKGFVRLNNKEYTFSELFNYIYYEVGEHKDNKGPIRLSEVFSSTILYLGSYLTKRGFTIDYINTFKTQKEELAKKLEQNNILSIAISTTFYTNPYPIREIIDFIKKHNNTAKIILGGPFFFNLLSNVPKEDLNEHLQYYQGDFYVYSTEGEESLAGIIDALKNGKEYCVIDNIYYRNGEEFVLTNKVQENGLVEDDEIDWDLFGDKVNGTLYLRTAKSCPFSCAFCSFTSFAGPYRPASLEYIEKRLDQINEISGINRVWFVDDTFNVPVERFKEILRMMVRKKYKFTWCSCLRCQFIDEETAALMKESKCENVFLGIESANQQVLNNMNKKVQVEQYYKGVSLLNEYGIDTVASFIIGFPGETHETYLDTKRFIEETKPSFFRAGVWNCLPLTPIDKEREKYNIQGTASRWSHSTMDSETAYNLVEDLFLTVDSSIGLTDHDISGEYINFMVDRGLSLAQIKKFYTIFNGLLRDKINDPNNQGVSAEAYQALIDAIC